MRPKVILWSALAIFIAGCSGAEPEQASEPTRQVPRRDMVFEPMTSTIDRAQGVQQTLDQQAAEQRRRIEESER